MAELPSITEANAALPSLEETNASLGVQATPEKPAAPRPEPDTRLQRFGHGAMDPIYGAAQLGVRMSDPASEIGLALAGPEGEKDRAAHIKSMDETVRKREEDIQSRRPIEDIGKTDWWRVGGSIPTSMAMSAPAMGLGPIAGGAAAGLTSALTQPVTRGDYAAEKTKDALFGTAFGGAFGAGGKFISGTVAPTVREVAKHLMDAGVELTPGQIAGGILRRAEEAAKSFPILGSFIRGAEGRSIETFDKAVINQALEPIGEKLPSAAKAGHDAVAYANLRLSEAYDNLLPKMNFHMDQQFASDLSNLRTLVTEMPKSQAEQFENILQNRVAKRLGPSGTMDGRTLKQVESELTEIGSQYRSSSDAAQRQLGTALGEVRTIIRDALERQNPQQADELRKINSAYAMFTRVQGAAGNRATSQGVFTPADLLRAIKQQDRTVRKGQFARGDALMQDFAEFGQTVLPGKMPDSGTPERAMWDAMGIARLPMAIPLGAASIPYTRPGTMAIQKFAQPGPAREAIGAGIRQASPMFSGAGVDIAEEARRKQ